MFGRSYSVAVPGGRHVDLRGRKKQPIRAHEEAKTPYFSTNKSHTKIHFPYSKTPHSNYSNAHIGVSSPSCPSSPASSHETKPPPRAWPPSCHFSPSPIRTVPNRLVVLLFWQARELTSTSEMVANPYTTRKPPNKPSEPAQDSRRNGGVTAARGRAPAVQADERRRGLAPSLFANTNTNTNTNTDKENNQNQETMGIQSQRRRSHTGTDTKNNKNRAYRIASRTKHRLQLDLNGDEAFDHKVHCRVCKAKRLGLVVPHRPHHSRCPHNRKVVQARNNTLSWFFENVKKTTPS